MITSTSLQHPRMQWSLLAAMMQAVELSRETFVGAAWVDIHNKRGDVCVVVRHSRAIVNRGLRFFDSGMTDVTEQVLKAIQNHASLRRKHEH
jgi:hypothetical protein